jgi:DNA-binding beta-propeller fold protein YncE
MIPRFLSLAALSLIAAAAFAGSAFAEPPLLVPQFCTTGSAPGLCSIPRGVAVNPDTGDIYLADQSNRRIQRFTAWGEFVGAWGTIGSGPGQFNSPQGVAIDSQGDVYVVDHNNRRVQKFDSEGNFLLMFGGEVNKTTNANLCTAASGDSCGAGVEGTADGFFGSLAPGASLGVGPDDEVYVGESGRIQVFDSNGLFLESIVEATALPPGERIQSLAVDPDPLSPSIYFTLVGTGFNSQEDVRHLDLSGAPLAPLKLINPRALAVDPATGNVYVHNKTTQTTSQLQIFDSAGQQLESFDSSALVEATGLAISSPPTCGLEQPDLILVNPTQANSFARIYGPPPHPDACPPPAAPPTISDQFATTVDSGSAVVRALINPFFFTTTTRYYVEFGTAKCSDGGCTSRQPAAPGALLTGPVTNQPLSSSGVFLTGLAPDTTYHYRFVAQSAGGGPTIGAEASFQTFPQLSQPPADACPNAALRTGASARLPDCRAYEMVSPPDKGGADVGTGSVNLSQADLAGARMTFTTKAAFGDPEGAYLTSPYLATRDVGSGWESDPIAPPRDAISLYPLGGLNFQYKAFSPDLCDGWFVQDSDLALLDGAPAGVPNLYRRDLCGGGFELLSSATPPNFSLDPLGSEYYPEPQGSSADGTRSVFRADDALTADAAPETPGEVTFQLYLSQPGEPLRLVSVLPSASSAPGEAASGDASAGTATPEANAQLVSEIDNVRGAVSADGTRVYWTDAPETSLSVHGGGRGELYLRENAGAAESAHDVAGNCTEPDKACTYPVSGLISTSRTAQFWQGSGDGSRAIFSLEDGLYEFAATEDEAGLLETEATPIAAGFEGFLGASADLSRVYFVSGEELAPGSLAGANNLYLHQRGEAPRFIAALSDSDVFGLSPQSSILSPVAITPSRRSSRVSPDGLHLALTSTAPLTGFDNADRHSGKADAEVFLYQAAADGGQGRLLCASCDASGARPLGRELAGGLWAAARIPGWSTQFQPSRALSDDGRRLFFESFGPLLPRDTNGRADVYLWQASTDKAHCLTELRGELFLTESGGCLSLISTGQSSEDSEFFDATPSGDDVFFATLSGLVPSDTGLVDVYDARVGGGFPEPPPPPAACEGEACQSPPPPPPARTPASLSFSGPENLGEGRPRCPKGKVRRGGSCVKRVCPKGKRRLKRNGKVRCAKRKPSHRRQGPAQRRSAHAFPGGSR